MIPNVDIVTDRQLEICCANKCEFYITVSLQVINIRSKALYILIKCACAYQRLAMLQ